MTIITLVYLTFVKRPVEETYRYVRESVNSVYGTIASLKQVSGKTPNETNSPADIQWGRLPNDDYDWTRLTVRGASFDLHLFRMSIQGALKKTKRLLLDKLLLGLQPSRSVSTGQNYFDLMESTTMDYSFVSDPKNQELCVHKNSLAKFIVANAHLKNEFFLDDGNTINKQRVATFFKDISEFIRLLLILVHVTYGQPARATELHTLLLKNSPAGPRSLYWRYGTLVIHLKYNKTRSSTGQDAFVPRFLPPEVASLLLWYLVYVKPFAEQVFFWFLK